MELGCPVGEIPAGTLVGAIGLKGPDVSRFIVSDYEREAGYWIGKPYWGLGLASEALSALIESGPTKLGVTKIWATHATDNERSHRVMVRCGLTPIRVDKAVEFPLIGVVRDEAVLAIDLRSAQSRA
nr:GNAT family N-acetyltransferase [Collinsella vaginalis]